MRPRSALGECFSVMRIGGRRKKPELRIRARRKCAEGDEKFYELARRAAGGWFELHQLKKAVPQKFHNAASRRDTTGERGAEGKRESARRVKCPSSFAAFPRFRAVVKPFYSFAPRFVARPARITTGCHDLGISRN